jgi:hypothetical protein
MLAPLVVPPKARPHEPQSSTGVVHRPARTGPTRTHSPSPMMERQLATGRAVRPEVNRQMPKATRQPIAGRDVPRSLLGESHDFSAVTLFSPGRAGQTNERNQITGSRLPGPLQTIARNPPLDHTLPQTPPRLPVGPDIISHPVGPEAARNLSGAPTAGRPTGGATRLNTIGSSVQTQECPR